MIWSTHDQGGMFYGVLQALAPVLFEASIDIDKRGMRITGATDDMVVRSFLEMQPEDKLEGKDEKMTVGLDLKVVLGWLRSWRNGMSLSLERKSKDALVMKFWNDSIVHSCDLVNLDISSLCVSANRAATLAYDATVHIDSCAFSAVLKHHFSNNSTVSFGAAMDSKGSMNLKVDSRGMQGIGRAAFSTLMNLQSGEVSEGDEPLVRSLGRDVSSAGWYSLRTMKRTKKAALLCPKTVIGLKYGEPLLLHYQCGGKYAKSYVQYRVLSEIHKGLPVPEECVDKGEVPKAMSPPRKVVKRKRKKASEKTGMKGLPYLKVARKLVDEFY